MLVIGTKFLIRRIKREVETVLSVKFRDFKQPYMIAFLCRCQFVVLFKFTKDRGHGGDDNVLEWIDRAFMNIEASEMFETSVEEHIDVGHSGYIPIMIITEQPADFNER